MQVGPCVGEHKSMVTVTLELLATQGWKGLFQGISLNYAKAVPATAVGFTVYDFMKDTLALQNQT